MRVGIVLLSLGIGGAEKRFATLFQFLVNRSPHQYYLVAPDGILRSLQQQGFLTDTALEIHRIDCGPWQHRLERLRWPLYSGFLAWRRGVNDALRRANTVCGTDVLHHVMPISYFMASRAFREHSVVEAQASTQEWHIELMVRAAARRGAVVNCLSLPIHRSLEQRLTRDVARRLHVSPGSLLECRDDVLPGPKERRVVFVGRLEAVKNPLLFVEAIARLKARTRDFRASILGDGRLRDRVDARIRELGLTDIVDRAFHHTPRQVLAEAAVFVSLQTYDNYPSQALMEAMVCRCATVATDVGATRRLVTPETGLVVPFDSDAVADAIGVLLDDPARASQMGCAARELVRREHSIERYAEHIERLYEVASTTPESA